MRVGCYLNVWVKPAYGSKRPRKLRVFGKTANGQWLASVVGFGYTLRQTEEGWVA